MEISDAFLLHIQICVALEYQFAPIVFSECRSDSRSIALRLSENEELMRLLEGDQDWRYKSIVQLGRHLERLRGQSYNYPLDSQVK